MSSICPSFLSLRVHGANQMLRPVDAVDRQQGREQHREREAVAEEVLQKGEVEALPQPKSNAKFPFLTRVDVNLGVCFFWEE